MEPREPKVTKTTGQRVYGSYTVEPGGWDLENEYREGLVECPLCKSKNTVKWRMERAEGGSLNVYIGLQCDDCGYRDGDHPDDESVSCEEMYIDDEDGDDWIGEDWKDRRLTEKAVYVFDTIKHWLKGRTVFASCFRYYAAIRLRLVTEGPRL